MPAARAKRAGAITSLCILLFPQIAICFSFSKLNVRQNALRPRAGRMGAQCKVVHLFSRRLETWVSSFLVKKGDKTRGHTQRSNEYFSRIFDNANGLPSKPKGTGQALVSSPRLHAAKGCSAEVRHPGDIG